MILQQMGLVGEISDRRRMKRKIFRLAPHKRETGGARKLTVTSSGINEKIVGV